LTPLGGGLYGGGMKYTVQFKPEATKELRFLPRAIIKPLIAKLNALAENPYAPHHDVKKLTNSNGEYRLRHGSYRVRYKIEKSELLILVIQISHRSKAYA